MNDGHERRAHGSCIVTSKAVAGAERIAGAVRPGEALNLALADAKVESLDGERFTVSFGQAARLDRERVRGDQRERGV
jgi:hypothetical protein